MTDSPTRDGSNNAHVDSRWHGRREPLQPPAFFLADIDVCEAPHLTRLIDDASTQCGIVKRQGCYDIPETRTIGYVDLHLTVAVCELHECAGEDDADQHGGPSVRRETHRKHVGQVARYLGEGLSSVETDEDVAVARAEGERGIRSMGHDMRGVTQHRGVEVIG